MPNATQSCRAHADETAVVHEALLGTSRQLLASRVKSCRNEHRFRRPTGPSKLACIDCKRPKIRGMLEVTDLNSESDLFHEIWRAFFFSALATLGVWFFTFPARAKLPCTWRVGPVAAFVSAIQGTPVQAHTIEVPVMSAKVTPCKAIILFLDSSHGHPGGKLTPRTLPMMS